MEKRILLSFFAAATFAVAITIGCSPVQFSSDAQTTNCTVSNPCSMGLGLDQVQQTFNFSNSNKVDILVVDDNSASMTTEQENLGTPFNGFINNLNSKGLDWQIGITNTDVCGNSQEKMSPPQGFCPTPGTTGMDGEVTVAGADGALMGPLNSSPMYGNQYIISPATLNASAAFYNTIQRQNQIGSGDERAIYAANLAVDGAGSINAGLFRADSNLAVVILSDENERSVGGDCTETDPADPTQYSSFPHGQCDYGYASLESLDYPDTLIGNVQSTWGGAKNLSVYSIVIKPDDMTLYPDPNLGNQNQTCLEVQAHQPPAYTAHPGSLYEQISTQTGGVVGSICNNTQTSAFANMLNAITGSIGQNSNIITLAYIAASQPTVTFSPPGNAVSWTWSGNQITLATVPAAGTTVDVTYDYSPSQQGNFQIHARGMSPKQMQLFPL